MKRRDFLATTGAAAVGMASLGKVAGKAAGAESAAGGGSPKPQGAVQFDSSGTRISIKTAHYSAEFDGPRLTRFAGSDGRVLVENADEKTPAVELIDAVDRAVALGGGKNAKVHVVRLGPNAAEVIVSDWQGDGAVRIEVDEASGDLCVTPSVTARRQGIARVRWNLAGIKPQLDLVAPFYQGTRLKLNDSLIANQSWKWPMAWEAGLAILQEGDARGMSVCCHDDRFRYKNLFVGHRGSGSSQVLGFETENYGPWRDQQAAGGLTWRINAHTGDWRVPAEAYRRWLWQAYSLDRAARLRPSWAKSISLAVSWCPNSVEVLEALAKRHAPARTLLHVPGWRDRDYDEDYPRYVASEQGRAFLAKAQAMGFHVMPHFNFFTVDPSNPVFQVVGPFVYRKLVTGELDGWGWKDSTYLGIPQSGSQLTTHRSEKVMAYIHPGLSWWRAQLREQIAAAVNDLKLDAVFVDQTLCTWNLENCLVENQTSTEGMWRLTRELANMLGGLCIGGEGLNEISMQWQTFAQAHLFKSHQTSIAGLERVPCPVNHFLFGDLCRTIGYSGLSGRDAASASRMDVHAKLGAIPTITIGSAREIERPNAAVEKEFARAAGK